MPPFPTVHHTKWGNNLDVTDEGGGVIRVDAVGGITGPPGPAGGLDKIQDEGTLLTKRDTLNFIGGGVTAVDNSANTRTNVTIPGIVVQEEGTALFQRDKINFAHPDLTAVDDPGNGRTNITPTPIHVHGYEGVSFTMVSGTSGAVVVEFWDRGGDIFKNGADGRPSPEPMPTYKMAGVMAVEMICECWDMWEVGSVLTASARIGKDPVYGDQVTVNMPFAGNSGSGAPGYGYVRASLNGVRPADINNTLQATFSLYSPSGSSTALRCRITQLFVTRLRGL